MKKTVPIYQDQYDGLALIADPIHQYMLFTVPESQAASEATEQTDARLG